jgi:predicted DNA-binding ribbon-helix-helix protein
MPSPLRNSLDPPRPSSLVSRNITVDGRRTSVRLEPLMWEALEEISTREGKPLGRLATEIDSCRRASSLTSAIRVFIVAYFRAATTENGHSDVGHGGSRP